MNNMTTGQVIACRSPLPIESIYVLGAGMSLKECIRLYASRLRTYVRILTFRADSFSFLFQRKRHQKGDESCASVIVYVS